MAQNHFSFPIESLVGKALKWVIRCVQILKLARNVLYYYFTVDLLSDMKWQLSKILDI